MSTRLLLLACLGSLVITLAGCPGSLENPGRFTGGLDGCADIPTLFASTCATTGCHASESPASGLDLASADIYGRLEGQKAAGSADLLIDTKSPESSVLYTKLLATPPFGARMPLSSTTFDEATLACVLSWIEKGGSP